MHGCIAIFRFVRASVLDSHAIIFVTRSVRCSLQTLRNVLYPIEQLFSDFRTEWLPVGETRYGAQFHKAFRQIIFVLLSAQA